MAEGNGRCLEGALNKLYIASGLLQLRHVGRHIRRCTVFWVIRFWNDFGHVSVSLACGSSEPS